MTKLPFDICQFCCPEYKHAFGYCPECPDKPYGKVGKQMNRFHHDQENERRRNNRNLAEDIRNLKRDLARAEALYKKTGDQLVENRISRTRERLADLENWRDTAFDRAMKQRKRENE